MDLCIKFASNLILFFIIFPPFCSVLKDSIEHPARFCVVSNRSGVWVLSSLQCTGYCHTSLKTVEGRLSLRKINPTRDLV